MDNYDVVCKYISYLTEEPLEVVINDATEFYKKYPACKQVIENTRISCFPAGELGVREITGYLRQLKQKFDYDMVIIDYDSNISPPKGDTMYEVGGLIYTAFKGFAEKERCVILIGSQPKLGSWEMEKLDMASAAESSRKQHVVDAMITIGRNKTNKNIGTINIPCIRRGESNVSIRVKFEYKTNLIKEITSSEYNTLLGNSKKDGTDDKLDEIDLDFDNIK
jgi:hypothetical protein